jgi:HK97 family phage major capsid protein
MNLEQMLAQLKGLKDEARTLLDNNKVDEAEAKMAEIRTLEEEIKQLQAKEQRTVPPVAIPMAGNHEARAAFNHFLRTGEIREGEATPLMVSSATKGAALAPVDFAKEIIDGLKDVAVMRQLADPAAY